jgi:hypothetical protein
VSKGFLTRFTKSKSKSFPLCFKSNVTAAFAPCSLERGFSTVGKFAMAPALTNIRFLNVMNVQNTYRVIKSLQPICFMLKL